MLPAGSNIGGGEWEMAGRLGNSEELQMPYNVNQSYFSHFISVSECWCDLISLSFYFLLVFTAQNLMGRRKSLNNSRLPAHSSLTAAGIRRIRDRSAEKRGAVGNLTPQGCRLLAKGTCRYISWQCFDSPFLQIPCCVHDICPFVAPPSPLHCLSQCPSLQRIDANPPTRHTPGGLNIGGEFGF